MVGAAILDKLRANAGRVAYKSLLYNWSLSGETPRKLLVKPPDPWPGDAEKGRWLCGVLFSVESEEQLAEGDQWSPENEGLSTDSLHAFEWLRDLRAMGRDAARRRARILVESWIDRYPSWDEKAWAPGVTGLRLATWIALYDFFGESGGESFQDKFFDSLARQARHLSRTVSASLGAMPLLYGIKGLIFAGTALEGRGAWRDQGLDLLDHIARRHILSDGGHISRAPDKTLETLRCFVDLRNALRAAGHPVPSVLQQAIERLGPALRFFRHGDKEFALFNGTQEEKATLIDAVLAQSGTSNKTPRRMPESGYERLCLGRAVLIVDAGNAPNFPEDKGAHVAPLAFEFSFGRDRVLTACGAHPFSQDWNSVLRGTAAHTAVTLDHRNAFEIREDGHIGRRARHIQIDREEQEDACLLEMAHDGYVPLNGILHRRRLYLGDRGQDLRGEDSLTCTVGLGKAVEVTARFHLHPKVGATLTQDGTAILLRLPGGTGWRFHHAGARTMTLDPGIYLGEGARPRKTMQIVLSAPMTADVCRIKWALQKEEN